MFRLHQLVTRFRTIVSYEFTYVIVLEIDHLSKFSGFILHPSVETNQLACKGCIQVQFVREI